jgi:hypothetical protein
VATLRPACRRSRTGTRSPAGTSRPAAGTAPLRRRTLPGRCLRRRSRWRRGTGRSTTVPATPSPDRDRGQPPDPLEDDLGLAAGRISPDADRHPGTGPGHPGQLRRCRLRLGGILHRVARRHHVEGRVAERQLLGVTDPQVRIGTSLAGDGEHRRGRVHCSHTSGPGCCCGWRTSPPLWRPTAPGRPGTCAARVACSTSCGSWSESERWPEPLPALSVSWHPSLCWPKGRATTGRCLHRQRPSALAAGWNPGPPAT